MAPRGIVAAAVASLFSLRLAESVKQQRTGDGILLVQGVLDRRRDARFALLDGNGEHFNLARLVITHAAVTDGRGRLRDVLDDFRRADHLARDSLRASTREVIPLSAAAM